jgi:hypothetical protein
MHLQGALAFLACCGIQPLLCTLRAEQPQAARSLAKASNESTTCGHSPWSMGYQRQFRCMFDLTKHWSGSRDSLRLPCIHSHVF